MVQLTSCWGAGGEGNPMASEAFLAGGPLLSSFPWHSQFLHCGLQKGHSFPSKTKAECSFMVWKWLKLSCQIFGTSPPGTCRPCSGFLLGFAAQVLPPSFPLFFLDFVGSAALPALLHSQQGSREILAVESNGTQAWAENTRFQDRGSTKAMQKASF